MLFSTKLQLLFSPVWLILIMATCGLFKDDPVIRELVKVRDLPADLTENSGMIESDGLFWLINDGDHGALVYGYNNITGNIDRSVAVRDAVNTDWEEITQDAQHVYIGDFGNNNGNRTDLRIYIVDKSDLQTGDTVSVSGIIEFGFEDQTDFTASPNNTSFDCEAFVVISDSVVLFTKDWITEKTKIYVLPAKPGTYQAMPRKEYDVRGLVTASAFSSADKKLLLLGYSNFIPFILEVPGFGLDDMSFAKAKRIDFTGLFGVQTEGILFSTDGTVFVSCEGSPGSSAAIFRAEL